MEQTVNASKRATGRVGMDLWQILVLERGRSVLSIDKMVLSFKWGNSHHPVVSPRFLLGALRLLTHLDPAKPTYFFARTNLLEC